MLSARKRLLVSIALGLGSAMVLITVAFFGALELRDVAAVVWAPGEFLVRSSNAICPPLGVECFLGSRRQGAHHLWLLICLLVSWGFILSVAWWCGLSLTARSRADALKRAAQRER
jgi:hypothetical protein